MRGVAAGGKGWRDSTIKVDACFTYHLGKQGGGEQASMLAFLSGVARDERWPGGGGGGLTHYTEVFLYDSSF